MTILNYEIHNDVADFKSMMSLFRTFAVAQGWTSHFYETSKVWANQGGGVYGWSAGTEDFLLISSVGFGAQDLQFRFRIYPTADPLDGLVEIYAHRGPKTVDTASSVNPASQTTQTTLWSTRPWHSFPTSTISSVWFFGNDKVLFIAAKVDSLFVKFLGPFGSLELFDVDDPEGDFCTWQSSSYTTAQRWYNHNVNCPLDNAGDNIYYNGARKTGSTNNGPNFVMTTTTNTYTSIKFNSVGHGVLRNQYSDLKPIFKQLFYVQDTSDSLWLPVGTGWLYRMHTEGLEIGQKVKYGSDFYITFPNGRVLEYFKGVAVRVAS